MDRYGEDVNDFTPAAALDRLARLDRDALDALHRGGTCPDPADLGGVLDGAVLTGPLSASPWRQLRVWRGKVATVADGRVSGVNRLGVGPVESRRFTFTARVVDSSFSPRRVLLLDHDAAGNPGWVRRFHDELVELAPGVYLATSHHLASSHYRAPSEERANPRYLAHFALVRPHSG